MNALVITPDQHADRARLRGCRNCTAYDGAACRKNAPGQNGFAQMPPDGWCLDWAWVTNPRQTWNSPLAPKEYEQADITEGVPF